MESLLHWQKLMRDAQKLVQQLGFNATGTDEWPLYFQYKPELLGLQFQPITLAWRTLATPAELVQLLFELSFSNWLYELGLVEDPIAFGTRAFQIPPEFKVRDLGLANKATCYDPLLRVRSYLPVTPALVEVDTVIERLDIDYPDVDVQALIGYGQFYVTPIEKHYQTLDLPYDTDRDIPVQWDVLLARYLRYALLVLHAPLTPAPVVSTNFTYPLPEDDYDRWTETHRSWILAQSRVLLLVFETLRRYTGYSYEAWNQACRRGSFNKETARLMGLLQALPPMPVSVRVNRFLRLRTPPQLNVVIEETALMATALADREHRVTRPAGKELTYLDLAVPAGTPVFCLLLFNAQERELVLPPGTKYVLEERVNEQVYRGRVI